eukprot:TRINITY_DN2323_c0_g1_i1.p1 TRINITY_DN2323_c0_g1~~TRINITY_DN2323_c0_g1_i1.p1  ORF type:complete len:476 (+),score=61.09 TRINITY_DN2323_c0_g1_i1:55-1482(+)
MDKPGSKEFTAVLLAGGEGTRLSPLTQGKCKALLPVGNHPILKFSLRWLAKYGYPKPLIVTTDCMKGEIEQYLSSAGLGNPSIHTVPEDTDTAQALRAVADKIERNAIVVSCDTITDVNLTNLTSYHRSKNATATILMKHAKPHDKKSKERYLTEYVGLDEQTNRVTLFASSAELRDPVDLGRALLTRRPNMLLTRSLLDAHVHIFSKWAVNLIASKERYTSLKHEVLPSLCAHQFRRKTADGNWGGLDVPPPQVDPPLPAIDFPAPQFSVSDIASQTHNNHPTSVYDPVSVYAYIADNDGVLCKDPLDLKALTEQVTEGEYISRVNYLSTYLSTNKDLAKSTAAGKYAPEQELLAADFAANWQKPSKEGAFPAKATVSTPSLVGENYQPEEGAIVKATTIGNNVKVGAGSRVSHSVIMDGVIIASGCIIDSCIIGSGTRIPEGSKLKDCILGNNITNLPEESEHKNEILSNDDF